MRGFLHQVAARTPAPGGGAAAALTAALAAGLAAMAARFSTAQLPGAETIAHQAGQLRERAARLADDDAAAYQAVLDAYALPRDAAGRREQIRRALHGAAMVPLEIAQIAAQLAGLAARLASDGNPRLRGDAITAVHLAEASARSAAALVNINAGQGHLPDGLTRQAASAVAAAQAATARVSARTDSRAGPG